MEALAEPLLAMEGRCGPLELEGRRGPGPLLELEGGAWAWSPPGAGEKTWAWPLMEMKGGRGISPSSS